MAKTIVGKLIRGVASSNPITSAAYSLITRNKSEMRSSSNTSSPVNPSNMANTAMFPTGWPFPQTPPINQTPPTPQNNNLSFVGLLVFGLSFVGLFLFLVFGKKRK